MFQPLKLQLLQVLLLRRPVLLLLLLLMLMLLLQAALLAETVKHACTLSAAQSRRKVGDLTLAIRTTSAMHAGLFARHSVTTWTLHGHKGKKEMWLLLSQGNAKYTRLQPL